MSLDALVDPNPKTKLYIGDCVEIMRILYGTMPKVDLAFADPPFNIGVDYKTGDQGWGDNLDQEDYEEFTKDWLAALHALLSDRGSLWVHVPDEIVSFVDQFCQKELGLRRVDWIIWAYRFGVCIDSKFIRGKCHCLHFVKNYHNRIWHPERILVPSDRATIYNDPRTEDSATPGKRVPLDVWGMEPNWGRVQGNNKERRALHPNQLPEVYLERILRCSCEPESLVFDPFCGSGTTQTVARALGLASMGCELNPAFAQSAWERITVKGAVRIEEKL